MKYYNLDKEQALHWPLDTFLVMTEPPPDGYELSTYYDGYAYFANKLPHIHIKLPFAVGDIVGFRETWAKHEYQDSNDASWDSIIVYKADLSSDKWKFYKWHSSATMPSEAIRKGSEVVSADCKRVQELTMPEWDSIGVGWGHYSFNIHDVINHFNAKYAKPKAIRKHGKIVGYKCYGYDIGSWFEFMYNKKCYMTGEMEKLHWKRLPLEILTKPFIQLVKTEEIEKP